MQHGQTHFIQAVNIRRAVTADPDDKQIRFQRQDPLEVDAAVVAHARQHLRRLRVIAGAVHPHHLRPGADGKQQFGEMRRQRNDALRRPGKFEGLPGIVDEVDGGCLRRQYRQQAQAENDAANHRSTRALP